MKFFKKIFKSNSSWKKFEDETPKNNEKMLVYGPPYHKEFEGRYVLDSDRCEIHYGMYDDGKRSQNEPFVSGVTVIPMFWCRTPIPPIITIEELLALRERLNGGKE